MNKVELIAEVAQRLDTTKSHTNEVLETLFGEDGVIMEALRNGEEVRISGFGVFGTKEKKARTARNPRTGEAVQVAAKTVPSFRWLSAAKKGL